MTKRPPGFPLRHNEKAHPCIIAIQGCAQTVKKTFREVWRATALQMQSESGDMCGGFASLRSKVSHWENRIKTPLETALDSCVRAGVLDGWEYCGAKKAKLSDSEVDIGDYATFIGLYVRFRMGRMNDED